jgi:hypothetical protein
MNFNLKSAWRKDKTSHSLSEVYSSIKFLKMQVSGENTLRLQVLG